MEYSGFNSLSEYEQDLAGFGFPSLLPPVAAGDFAETHLRCLAFDRRLQEFLNERSVGLNAFATLEELQKHLQE